MRFSRLLLIFYRKERDRKVQQARLGVRKPYGFIAVCVIPTLILTIVFMLMPTIQAFTLSLTDATAMGGEAKFIGLENYREMFDDKYFIMALKNTGKLMLVVPIVTVFFALVLAFILTQCKLKEASFHRAVLFFPSMISLTVVGIVWSFVFHPNAGIVTKLMTEMGLGQYVHPWLGDSKTALWCIAVTLVWQAVGYYMVMHIAAIDGVSPEIYEAATVDGASQWHKFFYVTLPLLKNIIGITYVLSLSGTMNLSFVLVQVMTAGGPAGASSVLLQYMYKQSFQAANFGYAMAIAVFTLAISIVLSLISRKLTENQD